jgi:uncharacterized protein (TIGR03067 family)
MPTIRRRAALALALAALAGAPLARAHAQDEPRNPLRRFQGAWTATFEGQDATWTFAGEKVTVAMGDRTYKADVTVDREAMPRAITFKVTEGPEDAQGKTVNGIYRMEEGKLVVCTGAPGEERPEEFKNAPDDGLYLFTLTRKDGEGDAPSPMRRALRGMQGTWKTELPNGDTIDWVIRGRRIVLEAPNRRYVSEMTVDPEAKPHASVDFEVVEGPEDAQGKTIAGIYKLDGETLVICIDGGAGARPTEFKSEQGQSYSFELKKVPAKD